MPQPLSSSLLERLKALGVKVGASDLTASTHSRLSVEQVMEGRLIATHAGEVFCVEQTYPSDYRHGMAPLTPRVPLGILAAFWPGETVDFCPQECLFLDIETSGLAIGGGTFAFMVGIGTWTAESAFRVTQLFLRHPGEEVALLEILADFLAPYRLLITFNGKAFDVPLLETRYLLHSLPSPLSSLLHLDLLPPARRLWRDRLPSRALKFLEEHILAAPRSYEEVPGYEIPYLYFDYLRSGNAAPLRGVFYHNAMDILALAALTVHIATILHDPFAGSVQHGLDFIALGKLFEERAQWDTAARLYERGLEIGVNEADFWQTVRRLAILQRRRGDLETARRLWEQAANNGHIYAHIELAKYYEHHRKEYATALYWCQRASQLLDTLSLPEYAVLHWREEVTHRQKRLLTKLQRKGRTVV